MCMHGSDPPQGWAALDLPRPWIKVRVPVVLMREADAAWLKEEAMMATEEVKAVSSSSMYEGWFGVLGDGDRA